MVDAVVECVVLDREVVVVIVIGRDVVEFEVIVLEVDRDVVPIQGFQGLQGSLFVIEVVERVVVGLVIDVEVVDREVVEGVTGIVEVVDRELVD